MSELLMSDIVDEVDYRKLLQNLLMQAVDDYIKLQHPAYRRKTYLEEAFLSAVDMFFDAEYQFSNFKTNENTYMALKDLVSEALQTEDPDIEKFKANLIEKTKDFWHEHRAKTIYILDFVSIEGHTFETKHFEIESFEVDWDNKIIMLNKLPCFENEKTFMRAITHVALELNEMDRSYEDTLKLSGIFFNLFKTNDALRIPPRVLISQEAEQV